MFTQMSFFPNPIPVMHASSQCHDELQPLLCAATADFATGIFAIAGCQFQAAGYAHSGSKEAVVSFDKQRWDVIATQHNRMRTGADCLIRWTNHLCPALRKLDTGEMEPWGKEEEATMCQIAEAKGERNVSPTPTASNAGSAIACLHSNSMDTIHAYRIFNVHPS